jgi:hypothetical protein
MKADQEVLRLTEGNTTPTTWAETVPTFGRQFMTPYDTPVEGYDPGGVKTSWTTNEDKNG